MESLPIMTKAKELIGDYLEREFNQVADFSDPTNVGLAYTTLTDYEIPIQVNFDLTTMELKTYIGTDFPTKEDLVQTKKLTLEDLAWLDFDDLTGWGCYVEDHIEEYI